jgi:hypothetical protein
MNIEKLKEQINQNPFSSSPQSEATIWISKFFKSLTLYHDELESVNVSNESLVKAMTPEFQRSNAKWSKSMKIAYMENLLSGYRGEMLLYYIDSQDSGHCYILDGLQRITAIKDFMAGNITIFDGWSYADIAEFGGVMRKGTLTLKIFKFPDHRSACKHYIKMNEYITHSPEDLITAYKFLEKE